MPDDYVKDMAAALARILIDNARHAKERKEKHETGEINKRKNGQGRRSGVPAGTLRKILDDRSFYPLDDCSDIGGIADTDR